MKFWSIEEFTSECKDLKEHEYTYSYENMPKGICNGHEVRPNKNYFAEIIIDDFCYNLKGNYYVEGCSKTVTALEYVRMVLEEPSRMLFAVQFESCNNGEWRTEILDNDGVGFLGYDAYCIADDLEQEMNVRNVDVNTMYRREA